MLCLFLLIFFFFFDWRLANQLYSAMGSFVYFYSTYQLAPTQEIPLPTHPPMYCIWENLIPWQLLSHLKLQPFFLWGPTAHWSEPHPLFVFPLTFGSFFSTFSDRLPHEFSAWWICGQRTALKILLLLSVLMYKEVVRKRTLNKNQMITLINRGLYVLQPNKLHVKTFKIQCFKPSQVPVFVRFMITTKAQCPTVPGNTLKYCTQIVNQNLLFQEPNTTKSHRLIQNKTTKKEKKRRLRKLLTTISESTSYWW